MVVGRRCKRLLCYIFKVIRLVLGGFGEVGWLIEYMGIIGGIMICVCCYVVGFDL